MISKFAVDGVWCFVLVAVIPDPRAARSLRFSLFAFRTVDGYHPSMWYCGARGVQHVAGLHCSSLLSMFPSDGLVVVITTKPGDPRQGKQEGACRFTTYRHRFARAAPAQLCLSNQ